MKPQVLLLGCLLAVAGHAQSTRTEVWAWKDANGVMHYSDAPTPGARKIVIVGDSARPATAPAVPPTIRPAKPPAAPETKYSLLEIALPENETSFFGADAVVQVRVRSEPGLSPYDNLLTYLDGKLVPGENAYEHTFSNLERGAHSLMSVIVDSKGNEKIRSEPVVFHIKQNTIINNPGALGPNVRPKPKPRA
jgi:hypothetical protein